MWNEMTNEKLAYEVIYRDARTKQPNHTKYEWKDAFTLRDTL